MQAGQLPEFFPVNPCSTRISGIEGIFGADKPNGATTRPDCIDLAAENRAN